MSPIEILAIIGVAVWALYKQTQISEVQQKGRFKMAIIYAAVGLGVGGFARPEGTMAWTLLAISIVLSVVIGVARGHLTRLWAEPSGQVMSQGTTVTIALFLGLFAAKFGLGTFAYLDNVQDGAGFGEVMIMIAIMIVVQAEIVWRRARQMSPALTDADVHSSEPSAR